MAVSTVSEELTVFTNQYYEIALSLGQITRLEGNCARSADYYF